MEVMYDRLHKTPATGLPFEDAHLDGLALIIFENYSKGTEGDWNHDSEHTITPAPTAVTDKRLASQRSCEGSADERRADKSKSEGSVLQARSIGNENVENKVNRVIPNPKENVTGGEGIRSVACSKDDQAECVDSDEDEQTFRTAPNVKHSSNWQLQNTSDDTIQDIGRSNLRCLLKIGISG
ncbi:unnamed protein product [Aspergillus oryzae]|nr:unnamed protein product [Aspergillus oryzae]GMF90130.1 unnamed protein product [Aspergillus oryzae]GMG08380.1 unnamed protein product [Aspergillus oryzae]